MTPTKRRVGTTVAAAAVALVLASCAIGQTQGAVDVTDVNATLNGLVRSTQTGTTEHWFEYGTSVAYGSSTSIRSLEVSSTSTGYPVTAVVLGLDEGTLYHYRLCARDVGGHGVCGEDRTFTTTAALDSVTGSGTVFSLPELGYYYGASVQASSGADGSDPTGTATVRPGSDYFRFADSGPVTCLRVVGNRAAIGFLAQVDDGTEIPRVVFIEDNGPIGDRMSASYSAEPVTTCPEPTADSFVPGVVGGYTVGPEIVSGDFQVHDHD